MTIAYAVNGNAITAGIQAAWAPIQTGLEDDGAPKYNDLWAEHVWSIPRMEMTDYLTLQALRGTSITSVVTTTEDEPNTQNDYSTGRVMEVSGEQRGRQMLNVRVRFLLEL